MTTTDIIATNRETMTALLYTVEDVWVLEPTTPGTPRQFATARAAKAWAKAQRVTVRRATDCDSR